MQTAVEGAVVYSEGSEAGESDVRKWSRIEKKMPS